MKRFGRHKQIDMQFFKQETNFEGESRVIKSEQQVALTTNKKMPINQNKL